MKLKSILPAILFAAVSFLPVGAYAADTDKAVAADKTPAAEAPAAKPKAKKVKPHSHMEEKMGKMPQASGAAPADGKAPADEIASKPKAGKDKSKHFHPRDGK